MQKFILRCAGMIIIVSLGIPGLAVLPIGLAFIALGWWMVCEAEKL